MPFGLIVMDGWGEAPEGRWNAVRGCHPEHLDALRQEYPSTLIRTSGEAVGLPPGQIGNSEVGHLCIGAGRIVLTDLERINREIATGSFARNPAINAAADAVLTGGGAVHLLGLFSDGGVHSHIDHLRALVAHLAVRGVRRIYVHAFLDGRDTPPRSGLGFMRDFEAELNEGSFSYERPPTGDLSNPASREPSLSSDAKLEEARRGSAAEISHASNETRKESPGVHVTLRGLGHRARVASVSGRFYAMDRDNRWERVERAYRAMVLGEGLRADSGTHAIETGYSRDQGDEFVEPTVLVDERGEPVGKIQDGDAVIFFNFRADRAREMTRALTVERFDGFSRPAPPRLAAYVCFGTYDRTFDLPVAFPNESPARILGELLATAHLRQLRIAETEKYAHVTFFFNGGREQPFEGEERILVPSPRIATYDLQPEMSAPEVTARLLDRLKAGAIDFFLLNFANADMVGHSGIYEAAVRACREVDKSVGAIAREVLAQEGTLIVTADHGNAEQMWDPATNSPHTAHTTNPVPCIVAGASLRGRTLREGGILADLAPTILDLLKMDQPQEMTGATLLR